jgi:hypothetical protein
MWICICCGVRLTEKDVRPGVDGFGLHFICPECGRRNRLRLVGGGDDDHPVRLEQVDPME